MLLLILLKLQFLYNKVRLYINYNNLKEENRLKLIQICNRK